MRYSSASKRPSAFAIASSCNRVANVFVSECVVVEGESEGESVGENGRIEIDEEDVEDSTTERARSTTTVGLGSLLGGFDLVFGLSELVVLLRTEAAELSSGGACLPLVVGFNHFPNLLPPSTAARRSPRSRALRCRSRVAVAGSASWFNP